MWTGHVLSHTCDGLTAGVGYSLSVSTFVSDTVAPASNEQKAVTRKYMM